MSLKLISGNQDTKETVMRCYHLLRSGFELVGVAGLVGVGVAGLHLLDHVPVLDHRHAVGAEAGQAQDQQRHQQGQGGHGCSSSQL